MESEILNEQSDGDEGSEELESQESDDLFGGMEIPQGLEDTKLNMQRAFTKKTTALAEERRKMEQETERLKYKAEQYDKLAADPETAIEMLSRMSDKSNKTRTVDQDDDDDFADYGENAESMKRLVKSITNKVTKSITKEMSPLIQNVAEVSADKEMRSLSTWVKSQSAKLGFELPNPELYEPTIKALMGTGLSSIQAYQASMNLEKLQVRKPVIQDKKKPATFQPGNSGKGVNTKKVVGTEEANKRRMEGKKGLTWEEINAMYNDGTLPK